MGLYGPRSRLSRQCEELAEPPRQPPAARPLKRGLIGTSISRTSSASRNAAKPRMIPIRFGRINADRANVRNTATFTDELDQAALADPVWTGRRQGAVSAIFLIAFLVLIVASVLLGRTWFGGDGAPAFSGLVIHAGWRAQTTLQEEKIHDRRAHVDPDERPRRRKRVGRRLVDADRAASAADDLVFATRYGVGAPAQGVDPDS